MEPKNIQKGRKLWRRLRFNNIHRLLRLFRLRLFTLQIVLEFRNLSNLKTAVIFKLTDHVDLLCERPDEYVLDHGSLAKRA